MTPARSPYPGLRPFNRDESDLFYGRDRCISAMVETLQETRFLAVLGPSGSGKSSLVRSGLFLDLEAGRARKAGARWTFLDIRHPRQQPYRELARELLRYECEMREGIHDALQTGGGACNAPQFNPPDHVLTERRRQLRKDPLALARWWKENRPDERTNLLLLVDQFEELFGYGEARERNDVEAFVDMLLKCRASNDPAVYVVLTMRSEFLAGCTLFAGLSEQINKSLSLTPRMTREECRQAISGPAAMAEVTLEPLLVTTLLNDMNSLAQWTEETEPAPGGEGAEATAPEGFKQTDLIARRADQLPLMQHVLNWMWLAADARRGAPDEPIVLKLDDYLAIGGLTGALSRHAGEVMARTGDPEATERVFRALTSQPTVVSLGSAESSGVRRPRTLDQLVAETGVGEERVRAVVEAFRADGVSMLTPSTEIALTNDLEVDLAHESLIRQWGDLRRWIREEAENGRAWRELVRDTEQEGSARAELLRGLELSDRRRWWATTRPHPGWADRYDGKFEAVDRFMARSVAGEKRRKAVRYGGTGFLAVAALATGLYTAGTAAAAREAEQRSEQAVVREGAAQRKTELALRTMAEASRNADAASAKAREARRAAEQADQVKRRAEQARTQALAMAQQAQRQSALAESNRKRAELAQNQAETRARASVDLVSNVFDRSIIPSLRRASSAPPDEAAGIIALTGEDIELANTVSPAFFDALAWEITAETGETSYAALDLAMLDSASGPANIAALTGASAGLKTISLVNRGRALTLRGRHAEAESVFRQAVAAQGLPGAPDSPLNRFHTQAQLGLAEASLALQRREAALAAAQACLATVPDVPDELNRVDVDGFDFKLIRAQCAIAVGAAQQAQPDALRSFDAAAKDILDMERVRAGSPEVERATYSLALKFVERFEAGGEPPEGGRYPHLDRLLESVLSLFSPGDGGEGSAERRFGLGQARQASDPFADSAALNLWLAGDLLTRLIGASMREEIPSPADLKELGRAGLRFRSLVGKLDNLPGTSDSQLRAMIAGSLDRYGNLLMGMNRRASSPVGVEELEAFGESLFLGNKTLGPRAEANMAAREALLKRAIEIAQFAGERVGQVKYTDLDRYTAALGASLAELCGETGAVSADGCARLAEQRTAFEARAARIRRELQERAARARMQQANPATWADETGVALGGRDPLSCYVAGADKLALLGEGSGEALTGSCRLRLGRYAWAFEWDGRVWLFESQANLDRFRKDPQLWAPQFGGYDTMRLTVAPELALPIGGGAANPAVFGGYLGRRLYLFAEDPMVGDGMTTFDELTQNTSMIMEELQAITAASVQTAAANWNIARRGGGSAAPRRAPPRPATPQPRNSM